MYCPTCAAPFREHVLLDPNLQGFVCDNGDLFHKTLVEQPGVLPEANTVQPPHMTNDMDILRFWLTQPLARSRLPNQLAIICRRIVEIVEHNHRVAWVRRPFVFCPLCSSELAHVPSDDVYMELLRCTTGHEFWERGQTAWYPDGGVKTSLSAELPDEFMPQMIKSYVSDEWYIQPWVHPQVRGVLERFVRS
jgi:hypothetical protein